MVKTYKSFFDKGTKALVFVCSVFIYYSNATILANDSRASQECMPYTEELSKRWKEIDKFKDAIKDSSECLKLTEDSMKRVACEEFVQETTSLAQMKTILNGKDALMLLNLIKNPHISEEMQWELYQNIFSDDWKVFLWPFSISKGPKLEMLNAMLWRHQLTEKISNDLISKYEEHNPLVSEEIIYQFIDKSFSPRSLERIVKLNNIKFNSAIAMYGRNLNNSLVQYLLQPIDYKLGRKEDSGREDLDDPNHLANYGVHRALLLHYPFSEAIINIYFHDFRDMVSKISVYFEDTSKIETIFLSDETRDYFFASNKVLKNKGNVGVTNYLKIMSALVASQKASTFFLKKIVQAYSIPELADLVKNLDHLQQGGWAKEKTPALLAIYNKIEPILSTRFPMWTGDQIVMLREALINAQDHLNKREEKGLGI